MERVSLLFLFGLAFVVLPFGSSWHEIPKALLSLISIACLSIVFFWQGMQWKKVYLLFAGLFLVSTVGLLSNWTPTTFFGNPFRLQGVLTLWSLIFWSILSSQTGESKSRTPLTILALLLTTFIAIIGRTDASGRAVGSVGEANSLGAFAVFLVPLTQTPLAFIPGMLTVLLSGSRSAAIGFVAQVAILFGSKRFALKSVIPLVSILHLCTLLFPLLTPKSVFEDRGDIWRTAIQAGLEKPLFGWGIGNIEIGLRHAAETEQTFIRYQYVDSSHNIFLDWWVQGGIIGLTLFSALIVTSIRGLIRQKNTILLSSFFGILAVMLFNPVSISILVPFWWIVGKGFSSNTAVIESKAYGTTNKRKRSQYRPDRTSK